MEQAFVFALWGIVGILFVCLFCAAIVPVLFPYGEFRPTAVGRLDGTAKMTETSGRLRRKFLARLRGDSKKPLYCSFCGKSQHEVKLISGPTVFICVECVDLCVDIIREDKAQ